MGSLFFDFEVSALSLVIILLAAGIVSAGIKGFIKASSLCIDEHEERIAKIVCAVIIGIGVIGILCAKPIARGIVSASNEKVETNIDKILDVDWE